MTYKYIFNKNTVKQLTENVLVDVHLSTTTLTFYGIYLIILHTLTHLLNKVYLIRICCIEWYQELKENQE
jgi:hypothetical protein